MSCRMRVGIHLIYDNYRESSYVQHASVYPIAKAANAYWLGILSTAL